MYDVMCDVKPAWTCDIGKISVNDEILIENLRKEKKNEAQRNC